jgi:hypothetical protein
MHTRIHSCMYTRTCTHICTLRSDTHTRVCTWPRPHRHTRAHEWAHIHWCTGMYMIKAIYHNNMYIIPVLQALSMSRAVRNTSTVGQIVNHMAVDAQRIREVFINLWACTSLPVTTILGMYMLWGIMGPASLAGLAVLLALVPVNSWIMAKQSQYQRQMLDLKGRRVKLMNQVICGIKVSGYMKMKTTCHQMYMRFQCWW